MRLGLMRGIFQSFVDCRDERPESGVTMRTRRCVARVDQYIHEREQAKNAFELRYEGTIVPDNNRWKLFAKVLSRKDVVGRLSEVW